MINNLSDARRITVETTTAEGGAFDPAVMCFLATAYDLGADNSKQATYSDDMVRNAIDVLERNKDVAVNVSLDEHASILSSVASLICLFMRSPVLNQQSVSLGEQIVLRSSVPVEDPFRNLAMLSLRDLLCQLLDCGDCQHFVVCFEILRRNRLLNGIAEKGIPNMESKEVIEEVNICSESHPVLTAIRVREAYLAYIDVLSRWGLFTAASELIKSSEDQYISELSKKGIRIKVGCAKCGKEVAADQASGGSQNLTAITAIFCGKCRRSAGRCVVCHKPVLGLYRWCPICSHGGHKECIDQWVLSQSKPCVIERMSIARRKSCIVSTDTDKGSNKKNVSAVGGINSSINIVSCPSGCGHHCFLLTSDKS